MEWSWAFHELDERVETSSEKVQVEVFGADQIGPQLVIEAASDGASFAVQAIFLVFFVILLTIFETGTHEQQTGFHQEKPMKLLEKGKGTRELQRLFFGNLLHGARVSWAIERSAHFWLLVGTDLVVLSLDKLFSNKGLEKQKKIGLIGDQFTNEPN